MKWLIYSIIFGLVIGATIGCAGIEKAWVVAERSTYDALAPAHAEYVKADADLSENQKRLRLLLLKTWNLRIEEHEKLVEGK